MHSPLLAALLANLAAGVSGAPGWVRHVPLSTGAVCMDGSPAAYVHVPGTGSGTNKWVWYFMGGGWCYDAATCAERAATDLGTSTHEGAEGEEVDVWRYGLLSDTMEGNPDMHNWNVLRITYCDGGSHASDAEVEYDGQLLQFRGKNNRDAILAAVLDEFGAEMEEMVVAGCSAGGLAVWLGLDAMADQIHQANPDVLVTGLPDSGWFPDVQGPTYFGWRMRESWDLFGMEGGTDADCVGAREAGECFFAEYLAPHVSTPLFAIQSRVDSLMTSGIWGVDLEDAEPYARQLQEDISEALFSVEGSRHGAFVDSCDHHCTYENHIWSDIRSADDCLSMLTAWERWRAALRRGDTWDTRAHLHVSDIAPDDPTRCSGAVCDAEELPAVARYDWTLALRQTAEDEYFEPGEWLKHPDDPSAPSHAVLGDLLGTDEAAEDWRAPGGDLIFRLRWPRNDNLRDWVWRQRVNPVLGEASSYPACECTDRTDACFVRDGGCLGYAPIDVPVMAGPLWAGLEWGETYSLLDGAVGSDWWFVAVGSFWPYEDAIPAGFTGGDGWETALVTQVELYIGRAPELEDGDGSAGEKEDDDGGDDGAVVSAGARIAAVGWCALVVAVGAGV